MKKPVIGDIVEIEGGGRLRYAQYTHYNKLCGELLRVMAKSYISRPEDWSEVVNGDPIFVCFFPLRAALRKDIFKVIANVPVPESARQFPLFRAGLIDPKSRKVENWWLWDGEKEWPVGNLTPEQFKLPIRNVWNDTILLSRLNSGWRPENEYW